MRGSSMNPIPFQLTDDDGKPDSNSVAQNTISSMRERLGRSSIASRYAKLTKPQKLILLLAASINPNLYLDASFEEFNRQQREELRQAIINIQALSVDLSSVILTKDEFQKRTKFKSSEHHLSPEEELEDINKLINNLMQELSKPTQKS